MDIPVTPEERFTRIENFLSTVAEHQAHMSERQAQMSDHQTQHDKDIKELREIQKGIGLALAKVAQAQSRTDELQQITEQKLNALIDTVDRMIGSQGGRPS